MEKDVFNFGKWVTTAASYLQKSNNNIYDSYAADPNVAGISRKPSGDFEVFYVDGRKVYVPVKTEISEPEEKTDEERLTPNEMALMESLKNLVKNTDEATREKKLAEFLEKAITAVQTEADAMEARAKEREENLKQSDETLRKLAVMLAKYNIEFDPNRKPDGTEWRDAQRVTLWKVYFKVFGNEDPGVARFMEIWIEQNQKTGKLVITIKRPQLINPLKGNASDEAWAKVFEEHIVDTLALTRSKGVDAAFIETSMENLENELKEGRFNAGYADWLFNGVDNVRTERVKDIDELESIIVNMLDLDKQLHLLETKTADIIKEYIPMMRKLAEYANQLDQQIKDLDDFCRKNILTTMVKKAKIVAESFHEIDASAWY